MNKHNSGCRVCDTQYCSECSSYKQTTSSSTCESMSTHPKIPDKRFCKHEPHRKADLRCLDTNHQHQVSNKNIHSHLSGLRGCHSVTDTKSCQHVRGKSTCHCGSDRHSHQHFTRDTCHPVPDKGVHKHASDCRLNSRCKTKDKHNGPRLHTRIPRRFRLPTADSTSLTSSYIDY